MENIPINPSSSSNGESTSSVSPDSSLQGSFSKKKKIVIGVIGLVLLLLVIAVWMNFKKPQLTTNVTDNSIAKVNNTELPQSYLDYELQFFPQPEQKSVATSSAERTPVASIDPELKKMLVQKIIDDQITLEAAKKEGIIRDFNASPPQNMNQYLDRTKLVQEVREKINQKGNVVRGKMIMVWFYNNTHIGSRGFEGSKQFAYEKIKPLYDQVKSGQITIDQAGQTIKNDKSIADIDPVWEANAIAPFVYYRGGPATHWPEFNELIWETDSGNLTPLHLGGGILRDGKPTDELYIFAQIEQKSDGSSYNNYQEWLEQKRKEIDVSYLYKQSFNLKFWLGEVFAQEDGGNSSNDNGSNQNDSNDNSNGNNGSRSGAFNGFVRTSTGAPIPGATVRIWNGATSRVETTGGNGRYDTGTDYNLSCLNNPQHLKAEYSGMSCGEVTITMPNGDAVLNQDFTCSPPPPPPACNVACSTDQYCSAAQDGCTACLPNLTGSGNTCQKLPACGLGCSEPRDCQNARDGCTQCRPDAGGTGSVCQPPPPPACGASCGGNNDCTRNTEGCTMCVAGQCRIPPACNVSCTADNQCTQATDGCTACVPADNGIGSVCRPPAACNVACQRDDQCAGARDGCNLCIDNVCKKAPACNDSCANALSCARATDGCTECLPGDSGSGNVCRPVPACNIECTKDGQCAGAKDGCTVCLPNDAGTGKACRPVPGCGVACTRTGQCEGAKDGCTECVEQVDGSGICEEPFSNDMCKCDGFNAINLKYPTDKNFQFEAFAKVEGKDIKRAGVKSITIKLYKSSKTNPNVATVVAKSSAMTPQVVENTATKVRYKSTWSVVPPAFDRNAIFRVGADIECAPKLKKKASSSYGSELSFIPGGSTYDSDSSKVMASFVDQDNYAPFNLVQNEIQIPEGDDDGLQLGTLNFIRMVDTDACSFIRFEYQDY